MKSVTILLFGKVQNDSRVKRTIEALKDFRINLLSRDYDIQDVCDHAYFYHNRYTEEDMNEFEPRSFLVIKFFKKLEYYINTERIKSTNAAKIKTDIYYCNDFNTLISGFIASRKRKAKLVYDTHELWAERSGATRTGFNKLKQLLEYLIERFIVKRCELIITVSEGIADELVKRYDIKRPLVIRNLDTVKSLPSYEKRMEVRDSLNISRESTLIVYQGLLSKERGIAELIDSVNLLPERYHLLIMGWGYDKDLLNLLKINSRIHFLGLVEENILYDYTSTGDIGIAPIRKSESQSYRLAFPNKFSQYMNAGLALLLYNIESAFEIISRCESGILLEEISSEHIADKIQSLTNSNLNSMKQNSRECFLKYFNWGKEQLKLIKYMKGLLK